MEPSDRPQRRDALTVFLCAVAVELVEVLNRLPPEERNRLEQRLVRALHARVDLVEQSDRPVYRTLVKRLRAQMTNPMMDLLNTWKGSEKN